MAIAVDNTIAVRTDGTSGNYTQAFTCNGSNRALVVATFTTNNTVTVTYNGTSMTQIKSVSNTNGWEERLFLLINPSSGSNNIVVNFSTGGARSGFVATSYTGVKQTGQPDSSASIAQSTSSPYAMATTVVATGCWIVGSAMSNATGSLTAGTGTTKRASLGVGTSTDLGIFDSNGTVGTGSQSINAAVTGITNIVGAVMSLAPYPSTDYTMVADYGSYTLTGQVMSFIAHISIALSYGAYTLTGVDSSLKIGKGIIADYGAYVLTGVNANFTKSLNATLAYGSYTLTGISASIGRGYTIVAETGSYVLTGFGVMLPIFWKTLVKNVSSWFNKQKTNSV